MKNKGKVCDICARGPIQIRRVSRSYGSGPNLLVIEGVPVVVCQSCGESYLTAETLHELERIKLHRRSFARSRRVPIASFG